MSDGYGLETLVEGTSILQLTNDYRSHSLRYSNYVREGDFSDGSPSEKRTFKYLDITDFMGAIVFFGPESAVNRITPYTWSDGNRVYLDFAKWWNLTLSAAIPVYVFADWANPHRSEYGMQLLKNGQMMYDSGWHVLNIRKIITIPAGVPAFQVNSQNAVYKTDTGLPAGTYAVALSTYRQYSYFAGDHVTGDFRNFGDCIWMDGSRLCMSFLPVPHDKECSGGIGFGWLNNQSTQAMIVDTTNLPIPFNGG